MSNKSDVICSEQDGTVEVVISTLQELATEPIEINSASNLVDLFKEVDDSLGLFEFIHELQDRLCIRLSQEELSTFFWPNDENGKPQPYEAWQHEVAPGLTVSAFARWLQPRIKPVSFEPVSVLGSAPCAAAGYFLGMSELVRQLAPSSERFGPSTPIDHVLTSGLLREFWRRLSRASQRPLPPLKYWLNHLANVLLIGALSCILFGVVVDWAFLTAIWMLCLKVLLISWQLRKQANPLPTGIVTFGDLSRYLSRQSITASRMTRSRAGTDSVSL